MQFSKPLFGLVFSIASRCAPREGDNLVAGIHQQSHGAIPDSVIERSGIYDFDGHVPASCEFEYASFKVHGVGGCLAPIDVIDRRDMTRSISCFANSQNVARLNGAHVMDVFDKPDPLCDEIHVVVWRRVGRSVPGIGSSVEEGVVAPSKAVGMF